MVQTKIYRLVIFLMIFSGSFLPFDIFSRGTSDSSASGETGNFKTQTLFNYRRASFGPYSTAIGLCVSSNPGLSFKHFFGVENAFEIVLGTRWKGISLTALYERCVGGGTTGSGALWNFGGGPRLGFYNGESYKNYLGLSRESRTYSLIGFVGTLGFEYYFEGIPMTAGVEYRPFFDLKGEDDSILDAVVTIRYAF